MTADEVVNKAIPSKEVRDKYYAALKDGYAEWEKGFDTKREHTKNKDGTGGYTRERLKMHNAIIKHLLKDKEQYIPSDGKPPTLTLLGGRGGSGKSNFGKEGSDMQVYDPKKNKVLDSDEIKTLIPGYNPSLASLVHEESSDILTKAVSAARRMGMNVVIDMTMKSPPDKWLPSFKKAGYKTRADYVHRPADLAGESSLSRWDKPTEITDVYGKKTKFASARLVPVSLIMANVNNELNFDRIRHKVDNWSLFDHSGKLGVFTKVDSSEAKKIDFSRILKLTSVGF